MNIDSMSLILQASIAPAVLISGFGLLLLSMTNRIARPIDRIRTLNHQLRQASAGHAASCQKQIKILYQRCRILQIAIGMNAVSISFAAAIILMLFSKLAFNLPLEILIQLSFITSLVFLIVSLAFFLFDIRMTLKSLRVEIEDQC